jgi:hypothetical protein
MTEPVGLFVEWEPVAPCEAEGHTRGQAGCDPTERGTWIIDLPHGLRVGEGPHKRITLVVCQGKIIWLRSRLNETASCQICGTQGPLSNYVTIAGRVAHV